MIERLMNLESSCGKPGYSELNEQISDLCQTLTRNLDEEGCALLERLIDTYTRQNSMVLEDLFIDGFCAAIKILLDIENYMLK